MPNHQSSNPRSGRFSIWIGAIVLILGLGGVALANGFLGTDWWHSLTGTGGNSGPPKGLVTQPARTSPFLISLNVQGFLDSRKNATLSSLVEGTTTIISIVPEGTWVTEGQVVCELDASTLRENAKQQEISTTQAEAAMATAREKLEIQKTQNESDIAAANLKFELAQLDREKYEDGEFPQQEKQLEGDVAIATEDLIRTKENEMFLNGQVKKGYASQNELDAARIAVQQAQLKLRGAEQLLSVLQKFTYNRQIAELTANAKETERELARVRLKSISSLTQVEKEVSSTQLTYNVEKEKLARLQTQIENCTIRASQDGEVVYANLSGSGGRRNDQSLIEVGVTVRERQAIINLPDVTQMKVDCRIHESLIGSIRTGLKAKIRVDAYPDESFNGEISHVSSVPMSGNWPNTDLREYQTEVRLTDDVERIRKLRPGLTSQVEILVDSRSSVLQVPITAVVTVADKQVLYVYGQTPERRIVQIGASNQSHLEILDGLKDGELVIMHPRTQFASELAALEAEYKALNSNKPSAQPETPVTPPTAVQPTETEATSQQSSTAHHEGKGAPGQPATGSPPSA